MHSPSHMYGEARHDNSSSKIARGLIGRSTRHHTRFRQKLLSPHQSKTLPLHHQEDEIIFVRCGGDPGVVHTRLIFGVAEVRST